MNAPVDPAAVQAAAPVAPAVDFEKRTAQYVQLRDIIKAKDDAHKKAMEPYRETLAKLNACLLQHLNSVGGDGVSTSAGTVSRGTRKSASIADRAAFWSHVVVTANWDLLDYKANVTEVEEYITANNTPPPGVTYNVEYVVNVRRKSQT